MSSTKRRCGTCRYFEDAGIAGNGWCTHPKRQLSSDVRILVRQGELACRNSWGNDFWEDRNAPLPAAQPAPDPATTASAPVRASFDDEVTSVVSTDAAPARRDEQRDVVVEQTTLPDEPGSASRYRYRQDDLNEAAHQDQEERVHIIRRGERDAIMRARERHRLRRGAPAATDPAQDAPTDEPGTEEPDFAPDDFVEEEGPSRSAGPSAGSSSDHDIVLHESVSAPSIRSRRLRRTRGASPERNDPVPAAELTPQAREAAVRNGDDPRFDSVPEIKPDVELPRLRRSTPSPDATEHVAGPLDETVNPYDEVLKRAQAIKAAARAEREARQRQARRPIVLPANDAVPAPAAHGPDGATSGAAEPSRASRLEEFNIDDLHDEPDVRDEPAPPVTAHRLIDGGIRFRRPAPASADTWEDAAAWDDEPDFDDGENLPEPVRDRRWWRGLLPGRTRRLAAPRETARIKADEWHDEAAADDADADVEPVAHAGWREEDALDVVAEWPDEPGEPGEALDDTAIAPASVTADSSPGDHGAILAAEEAEHPASDFESIRSDRDQAPPAGTRTSPPPFKPLNLEDARGFNAFRSRLFAGPAVEDTPRAQEQPEPAHHGPVAVPRAVRPAGRERQSERATIAPEALLEDPRDAAYEPEVDPGFDIRSIIAQQSELLDMTIEIAPDVPRACATCRSYRASEQGERGWCTNTWAFTHRQMVNADDLACRSTIGCWWLPADREVWLDEGELVTHQPTPRVDRLVAHLQPLRRTAER